MVYAYVMLRTGTGESEHIIDRVRDLPEVAEAHVIAGDYDILAEIEVDDVYSVLHAAASKMQAMEGTIDTRTYIALD